MVTEAQEDISVEREREQAFFLGLRAGWTRDPDRHKWFPTPDTRPDLAESYVNGLNAGFRHEPMTFEEYDAMTARIVAKLEEVKASRKTM